MVQRAGANAVPGYRVAVSTSAGAIEASDTGPGSSVGAGKVHIRPGVWMQAAVVPVVIIPAVGAAIVFAAAARHDC